MDSTLPLWLQSALAAPPQTGQPVSWPAVPGSPMNISPYSGAASPYGPAAVAQALGGAAKPVNPNTQMPTDGSQPAGSQPPGGNQTSGINSQYNQFGQQIGKLLGQTVQGQGPIATGINSLFAAPAGTIGASGGIDPSVMAGLGGLY
jgi:hypothetical protein